MAEERSVCLSFYCRIDRVLYGQEAQRYIRLESDYIKPENTTAFNLFPYRLYPH